MAKMPRKRTKEETADRRSRKKKILDVAEFRKSLTKSMPEISAGFRDPQTWIDTGNYTLNKLISGDFAKGIPLGKVTMFAGESGAGKSYIASGNIVKNAQDQDIFVILVDSENALDKSWLNALNVDTSEKKILKFNMAQINNVGKMISDFVKTYRSTYEDVPHEEREKVLIVIDSLGMLVTPTESSQFEKGDMKGDMGIKAKQLKALVTNTVNMIADLDIGIVMTNHTYDSQDMFDPDPKVSGGKGIIYASSIVVAMGKSKLKEDEDGNKISDIRGIKARCKVDKTRYTKPFESVYIKIPYDGGMNPYSGLVDYFEKRGILTKTGNKLLYVSDDGTESKYFRKQMERNEDGILDIIMKESENLPDTPDEEDQEDQGAAANADEADDAAEE